MEAASSVCNAAPPLLQPAMTALLVSRRILATQGNWVPGLQALLQAGVSDPNATTKEGDTALHWASFKGDYDLCEVLLNNNADVNAVGDVGNTPLHVAAANGHSKVRLCTTQQPQHSMFRGLFRGLEPALCCTCLLQSLPHAYFPILISTRCLQSGSQAWCDLCCAACVKPRPPFVRHCLCSGICWVQSCRCLLDYRI